MKSGKANTIVAFRLFTATTALAFVLASCGGGGGGGATTVINGVPNYTVGGSISGLVGSVVLQNNGGDNLTVSASGAVAFATKVASGNAYNVTILTQPTGQTCSVSNGNGTISGNVTNVAVSCTNNPYTIGGSVTGLTGSAVLQNNGVDNLTIAANGNFTFAASIPNGSTYNVTVLTQPTGQTCSVSTGTGAVSGNNVPNVAVVCSTNTYSVGGMVSGLTGSLVLQDNNGDNLAVAANGTFIFATKVANGSPYSVSVLTQPMGQSCSVASGTGTIAAANVTNVALTCATNTYTIGGTVTGLSGSMVLQDNGGDNLTIAVNGSFTFATSVAYGNTYNVTVLTQPVGQTCSVSTGAGTVSGGNVTNVTVVCSTNTYNVGGTVSGLTGSLVLQDNNGDNLSVAANGAFTFATKIASGSPYSVTVLSQPTGQSCSVASGTGTIALANISNIVITCANNTYTVGGTVTGLSGSMVLRDNGGDNLTVAVNGSFTFATTVAYGNTYNVNVFTQPVGQICTVTGGSGTVLFNITNVIVSCTIGPTVGGTLYGLTPGNSIFVANNGANNLTLTANGAFTFPGTQLSGSAYSLSIVTLPINQPCTSTYGSGIVNGANVTNINLLCGLTPLNTFNTAGNLTTNTFFPNSATLLLNGKVLVRNFDTANLYDPASGLWTKTNYFFTARVRHTATLLPDGKVLVVGGGSGTSAELYDPATNSWAAASSATSARDSHTATLLPNGKVLVAGGMDGYTATVFNSAELYDPATNTWSAAANLATARYRDTATLLPSGKVLVAGGNSGTASLGSAELYDPATNTWAAAGNLNIARSNHTATLLPSGKVLVAGGDVAGVTIISAELYDPATNIWSVTGSLSTERILHTATLLPTGKVLVAGGAVVAGAALASAELYDPATGIWTATGNLNTARYLHSATLLQNGKALMVGGTTGATGLASTELYW